MLTSSPGLTYCQDFSRKSLSRPKRSRRCLDARFSSGGCRNCSSTYFLCASGKHQMYLQTGHPGGFLYLRHGYHVYTQTWKEILPQASLPVYADHAPQTSQGSLEMGHRRCRARGELGPQRSDHHQRLAGCCVPILFICYE